jgi:Spy/CpxP family protein refolding chaperone
MTARTVLGLAAALLLAASTSARADGPVPRAFQSLRPYQVVEEIMAQKELLNLTDAQFARLDDLSIAIQNEKHSYTHQGGKHHNTQHIPMVTRRQAYEQALLVLTPDQQARLEALFQVPVLNERAPRRPFTPRGKP